MKKNLLLVALCCNALIISCTESADKNSATTHTDTAIVQNSNELRETKNLCFVQQNASDTFQLFVKLEGNRATGSLIYQFKEKDSNRGEIEGNMKGDTLLADYTFNSEGISSVRQVAFLIKNDKATEGYADLEQKDGKMVFKDISSISFGQGIIMTKTECK